MKYEKIENVITIHKGRKHEVAVKPTASSIRLLQIDDLRNDHYIKYTDDKNGILSTEEDLLIVWDGANAGTIGYGKCGFAGSTIAVLRKRNVKEYYTQYLGRFLQSQFAILKKNTTGSTIPHIDRGTLLNIQIPLPPLSEQIQIAEILTQAETLIAQRKESIRLLDELVKSQFLEMFGDPVKNEKGWEVKRLGDIARLERGRFSPRPRNDPSYFDGNYPFIQTGDISKSDGYLRHYTQTLNEKGIKVSKQFRKGTIVIAIVGATIGATAILDLDVYATDSIVGINCMEITNFNNLFLEFTLRFWKPILLQNAPEAARANINLEILKRLELIFPPISAQIQFANFLIQADLQKRSYQNSLQEFETFYTALSQKAFRGELIFTEENTVSPIKTQTLKKKVTQESGKLLKLKPTNVDFYKRTVLAAEIVWQLHKEPTFGHLKLQKLLYLCIRTSNMQLPVNFSQQAMGPYDPRFMRSIDKQLQEKKWFRYNKDNPLKYEPLANVGQHQLDFQKYYSLEQERIFSLIKKFKTTKSDTVEIVATLYACLDNIVEQEETFSEPLLMKMFYEWSGRKKIFDELEVRKVFQRMKDSKILPKGI
ncbi:restriction endonuclease subunit S [Leptospira noguchii]|uniref:Type I restriction modification DNA specificity domain protein n=1 Tax=Leptospira noguchii TaxID=28182 RepID=M6V3Y7_9LEPT|nr:restriction endonuclease subunit S [Leptospira noguchii]EMO52142.1 type I restriction modification DNA specificity domain protein [Leptospira noguchii]